MRAGIKAFAVTLFLLLGSTLLSAQELYLDSAVVLGGKGQTLGEVSIVTGASNARQLDRLLALPLPKLADHPALIPARDLQRELARRIGGSFVLVGGPIIYLPASVTKKSERRFYTSLLQAIETAVPGRSLRVEVWAPAGAQPTLGAIRGRLRFQFPSGSGTPEALASNSYVQYRGEGNRSYRDVPITLRVSGLVPVALENIPYGTKFSDSAVGYVSKDLSSLSGTPARLTGTSFRARSAITKGQVLYRDMVGKVLAIRSGKQIRIAFRKGGVTVSVPGSAYGSGSLGDTISVSPQNSGREVSGTIVSPTEVVVEE